MNWDQIKGKWTQMKGSAKTRWGKLTDDDLDIIAGQKNQLIGRIQERYGIRKEEARFRIFKEQGELLASSRDYSRYTFRQPDRVK